MKTRLVILALLLTGCAHKPAPPPPAPTALPAPQIGASDQFAFPQNK